MSIFFLILDFNKAYELSSQCRSELYTLVSRLNEMDDIQTLADYKKAKETFKELRTVMSELDRAVLKLSSSIPSQPKVFETDP